jgi:hypothetical protein
VCDSDSVLLKYNSIANSHNFDRNDTRRAAGIAQSTEQPMRNEDEAYLGSLYNGGSNEKCVQKFLLTIWTAKTVWETLPHNED